MQLFHKILAKISQGYLHIKYVLTPYHAQYSLWQD
jgi:hypothetical protein